MANPDLEAPAASAAAAPPDSRSAPQLIADLAGDLAALVRGELDLVRAEVGEKAGRLQRAGIEAALGAALMFAALVFLLQAVSVLLSGWLGPVWANLVLGLALAVVGYLAIKAAQKTAAPEHLAFDRSARQLKGAVETMKGAVSGGRGEPGA